MKNQNLTTKNWKSRFLYNQRFSGAGARDQRDVVSARPSPLEGFPAAGSFWGQAAISRPLLTGSKFTPSLPSTHALLHSKHLTITLLPTGSKLTAEQSKLLHSKGLPMVYSDGSCSVICSTAKHLM